MKILPVIDLKDGQVVHARGGHRDQYQPISSQLASDASPVSIGQALVSRLGLTEAYVADLDAIAGKEPAWKDFEGLLNCGLKLWVDAGTGDCASASRLMSFQFGNETIFRLIVGLESIKSIKQLAEIVQLVGADRTVFSLDLKHGQPLTQSTDFSTMTPQTIVHHIIQMGIQRLIVLEIASVGSNEGPQSAELCTAIHQEYPDIELIAGGGIRNKNDLNILENSGCVAALVATALHQGSLNITGD